MKPSLVKYLVCPNCRANLALREIRKKKDEVWGGILICKNRHKFKIKRGIPRLITDKSSGFIKTEKAFSSKWKRYYKK